MAFYETTFIVRPDLTSQQADAVGEKFSALIGEHKGKMIKTENWGLRTLAYRLNKHRKGHYIHFGYEADAATGLIDKMETLMQQSDDVIRFLTIRVDEVTKEPTAMMAATERKASRPKADA